MSVYWSQVNYLMSVFNLLPENHREKFTKYLDTNKLDRALKNMIDEKLLPQWLADSFGGYDCLYGTLNELRSMLAFACANGLLELTMSGLGCRYRLDLSARVIDNLLASVEVSKADVQKISDDLATRLNG